MSSYEELTFNFYVIDGFPPNAIDNIGHSKSFTDYLSELGSEGQNNEQKCHIH